LPFSPDKKEWVDFILPQTVLPDADEGNSDFQTIIHFDGSGMCNGEECLLEMCFTQDNLL
jgi:hypothetical protein